MRRHLLRRLRRATALRLSLQFALLYGVLSALIFAGAYALARYEVHEWIDDRMRSDAGDLAQVQATDGSAAVVGLVGAMAQVNFAGGRVFFLTDNAGNRLAGNLGAVPDDISRFLPVAALQIDEDADDEVSGYWMRRDDLGDLTLYQGTSDHVIYEITEALLAALALGFVALLLIGTLVGIRVGRLTGDRVGAISDALAAAGRGNMEARVPPRISRPGDDLGQVATSVNKALAQITDLMEAQEMVTAEVAHNLRTPMQRLRQRIERLPGVAPDDRAAALHEIDDILRTFRALLSLAELDGRKNRPEAAPLDFGALVRDVAETYAPVTEDAGMALALDLPDIGPTLRGDRALLVQMLANLIENAIHHARGATWVRISVQKDEDHITLAVQDDGPGIPADQTEAVFRRLHRVEPSGAGSGAGLGLAMVRAIARVHGGDARAQDAPDGASLEIWLKACPE